ncbi:outer membrane beta-barrel protein [Agarivorans sp. QJM3NY_33]|uniref:outer membrane beta-barrel protein n=1 Tax=Agarivorans sp. QJM3NY_33 TaxID=3421432 RepID=UPI003D7E2041
MVIFRAFMVLMGTLFMLSHVVNAKLAPQPYMTESGLALVPMLGLGYKYDDNITLAEKDSSSSNILVLDAALKVLAERDLASYELGYKISAAEYFESHVDDYLDHQLAAKAELELALRHRLKLAYRFAHQHEQRGRGLSQGLGSDIQELIYFQSNKLQSVYSYGAPQAYGRVDLQLSWETKQYQNLESLTQYRNWRQLSYGATFFYRVSNATELLLEAKQLARRYRLNASDQASRNNDDSFIYAGAEWDISGKSSGSARIGYEDKGYQSAQREHFSGLSWLLSFNYLPVEYSQFNVFTSKIAKDPDQLGNYIDETIYQTSWQHYWLDRLSTELSYRDTDLAYTGVDRDEQITLAKVAIEYELRRWLKLNVSYQREDKSSSVAGLSYQQNVMFIHFSGTL